MPTKLFYHAKVSVGMHWLEWKKSDEWWDPFCWLNLSEVLNRIVWCFWVSKCNFSKEGPGWFQPDLFMSASRRTSCFSFGLNYECFSTCGMLPSMDPNLEKIVYNYIGFQLDFSASSRVLSRKHQNTQCSGFICHTDIGIDTVAHHGNLPGCHMMLLQYTFQHSGIRLPDYHIGFATYCPSRQEHIAPQSTRILGGRRDKLLSGLVAR